MTEPVRDSVRRLPPSPPGYGLETIGARAGRPAVSLGLNEGPEPPFPAALEAITRLIAGVNRYPTRGSGELVEALARRHSVSEDEVFVSAGADSAIGYVAQACVDPGDEVVVPWPSFPSFARDPEKRDATPVFVPLVDWRIDVDAVAAAVTPRTRIVFVATPNNPTGLALEREELLRLATALPDDVLLVLDEAYFDYLDPVSGLDGIRDVYAVRSRTLVLRTFSKLYGLAGLRVGYAIGPPGVVDGMRRVQRGYDVGLLAQAAALASLGHEDEVARRAASNRAAVAELTAQLERHGLDPLAGSCGNFVLARIGPDAEPLGEALLERGIIVQSGAPFGAEGTLRITAGSERDRAALETALDALRSG
ncbi:MAG: histidinol-phosphate transaminase [Gaiellales bacterium]